jgi:Na+/melibiose symporter-like transporter
MTVLVNNTENERASVATVCLFFQSMAIAFSDVIVDALMCIQARKYPDGAEELQTLSWTCLSLGGLVGSIAAAFLTENYNPAICFQVSACFGLIIAFFALKLDVGLETEGMIVNTDSNFFSDLRRYISEIGQAIKIPAIHNMILYLFLYGLVDPSFSSFGYYFMLDVVQLSKFTYSMLTVLGFFCLLIGSGLYKAYFKEFEYRNLIVMEMVIGIIFAPFSYMFILRIN